MGLLEGKVALTTGATSGIGKRIGEVFVEEAARVVLAARATFEIAGWQLAGMYMQAIYATLCVMGFNLIAAAGLAFIAVL